MPQAPINEVVAGRLKAIRKAIGLSQAAVGLRMGLPEETSSARVNRWEKGVHPPSLEGAEALATALGVPLAALVSRDDLVAEIILGLGQLNKTQQQAILSAVQQALGAERAEHTRQKLHASVPLALASPKGAKRP